MNMQAVTVTLNPAIDQTVRLPTLQPGAVHRAADARNDAGGKGVNVAACLADWGVACGALGVLGRDNASAFEQLFAQRGIADHCLRLPGETRTNIKLVAADSGDTTDINLPGLALGATELAAVGARLAPLLRPGLPVVLSGSLPTGLGADAWARLQLQALQAGARVLLDSSGAPLAAALAAERPPHVVKPNREELEAWTGTSLPSATALRGAAESLLARGVTLVVVSMGTDGALFVRADGCVQARPARLAGGSSVGAGDAMVAGLAAALLAGIEPLGDIARLATAFSMSRLESGAARRLEPAQVRRFAAQVQVDALD